MDRGLIDVLDSLGQPRILVVGDLMIDRDRWVKTTGVASDFGSVIASHEHVDDRLGGTSLVGESLRALGAFPCVIGVLGDDQDGPILRSLLTRAGIESRLVVDSTRPTTVKERFLQRISGHHEHQLLRVDREATHAIAGPVLNELQNLTSNLIADCDAVIVSDYGKGTCTDELVEGITLAAREHNRPVVVDPPMTASFRPFRGCTVLTPNRAEASHVAGMSLNTIEDALSVGDRLCAEYCVDGLAITLDQDGVALSTSAGEHHAFASLAKRVSSTRGAGDVFTAMLALCLAAGLDLRESCELANVAAGVWVERESTSPVLRSHMQDRLRERIGRDSTKTLDLTTLKREIDQRRQARETIVFTNGCFDVLHAGHIACLEQAAAEGDCLIVAVNSDQSVQRLKGPHRPVYSLAQRVRMLAALSVVDYVIAFDEATPHRLLEELQPDLLVKGGDYSHDTIVGRELVESYGGEVKTLDYLPGLSTSSNLQRATRLVSLHSAETGERQVSEAG